MLKQETFSSLPLYSNSSTASHSLNQGSQRLIDHPHVHHDRKLPELKSEIKLSQKKVPYCLKDSVPRRVIGLFDVVPPPKEKLNRLHDEYLEIRVVGVEDRKPSDYGLGESGSRWKVDEDTRGQHSCVVEPGRESRLSVVRERKGSRTLVQGRDGKLYGQGSEHRDR